MPTIRDVAQLAGVSTATVSHVLNGTRVVSETSRDRVMAAMEQLKYQPNAVARSLRINQTLTIGLIIPDVELPFFAWVARSIEAAASNVGHSVILCNSNWSLEREIRYLDDLHARRVDGLICASLQMTAEHLLPFFRPQMPIVWFEQARSDGVSDAVLIDNFRGAYAATAHLIGLGHRRISCILGPSHSLLVVDRIAGFRCALLDHGIPYDETLMISGDYTSSGGLSGARIVLSREDRPTAIFAFNDMMALGALQAAREFGLHVPEDLAVMGFDGIPLTEYITPPLSTIRQPIGEMSRIAVEMLLERINTRTVSASRTVKLQPVLVCRTSTVGAWPRAGS